MGESELSNDDKTPTAVGCVLSLLAVAVILVAAIPIVRWRDAETGRPMTRQVAIVAPLLIGATFYGTASGTLNVLGVRLWVKPAEEDAESVNQRSPEGPG